MSKPWNRNLIRQYVVVIVVDFSILAVGIDTGWYSPTLVKLNNSSQSIFSRPITEEEGSWIVSIGSVIGIVCIFLTFLIDLVGRKCGLILACLPRLTAGFLLIYANEVWMLLLARALVAVTDYALFPLVPMYITEIASKEIRGSLGAIQQIMNSLGIVIMLSIGPFISYSSLNIAFTYIMIFTTIPLFFLHDGPFYLYSKGKKAEALRILTFYRDTEATAESELKQYEVTDVNEKTLYKKNIFMQRLFLKSLLLVVTLGIGCQLTGLSSIAFYLQTVLESCQTTVQSDVASVIIGIVQFCGSLGTMFTTDKFGRKPILMFACVGMALGMFGLGVFFKFKESVPVTGFMNFVPLISLLLVVYSYNAGPGTLFWVLSAELFDDRSRGIGMSIVTATTTLGTFLTTKYFILVISLIGPALTYWIFSINCVLICLFIMICVPETKGKSFAEIQDILRNKSQADKNTLEGLLS